MTSNDEGRIGRRDFLRGAAALGTLPAWIALSGRNSEAAVAQAASAGSQPILDLAEWTYGYIGMETVTLPRGELLTGKNIYVEFWVPRQIRHPYPIVLVHGGTGQGLDWMATPDGRRGWALQLVEQGYKVCVVDRPGHHVRRAGRVLLLAGDPHRHLGQSVRVAHAHQSGDLRGGAGGRPSRQRST